MELFFPEGVYMGFNKRVVAVFCLSLIFSSSAFADQLRLFGCQASITGGSPDTPSEVNTKQDLQFFAKNAQDAQAQADTWLAGYFEEISQLRDLPNSMTGMVVCSAK